VDAVATLLVVLPLAVITVAICPLEDSTAIPLVVLPLTVITVVIYRLEDAAAILFTVLMIAFVEAPRKKLLVLLLRCLLLS
jgi:hypothetical protein